MEHCPTAKSVSTVASPVSCRWPWLSLDCKSGPATEAALSLDDADSRLVHATTRTIAARVKARIVGTVVLRCARERGVSEPIISVILQCTSGRRSPLVIVQIASHSHRRNARRDCHYWSCLLYTSPSPRDGLLSRMPSS